MMRHGTTSLLSWPGVLSGYGKENFQIEMPMALCIHQVLLNLLEHCSLLQGHIMVASGLSLVIWNICPVS